MIGKKIRNFRELLGLTQVQLSKLSGINVGTIRKYELGIRKPKTDQVEKIADALGLNLSVFMNFHIETTGDVLSLLYAIDEAVDLTLTKVPGEEDNKEIVAFAFKNPFLKEAVLKWCEFKTTYDKSKNEILKIEDEEIRQKELDRLEELYKTFKLKSMGGTFNSSIIVTKEKS